MEYVRLGNTGKVSEIPFGTWRVGCETDDSGREIDKKRAHRRRRVRQPADVIDTTDVYGDGGDADR